MTLSPDQKCRLECLVLAQSFETYWAYYVQSSGRLFDQECREAGLDFVAAYHALAKIDPRVGDAQSLGLGADSDPARMVAQLAEWASGSVETPYASFREARFMFWALITGIKSLALRSFELERLPQMMMSTEEFEHATSVVRWRGRLPQRALDRRPEELVTKSSGENAIVVVADIRKSQDLMTYAASAADFTHRMLAFIEGCRAVVDHHGGLFDKFTGDGYVAYFTPTIATALGLRHDQAFLDYVRDQHQLAAEHFASWRASVRKLPSGVVGLAIGADCGQVEFTERGAHLIAVGDAIVWATRMSSEARAGETLLNNLLFEQFRGRRDLRFEERDGVTKSGESFLARSLIFEAEL